MSVEGVKNFLWKTILFSIDHYNKRHSATEEAQTQVACLPALKTYLIIKQLYNITLSSYHYFLTVVKTIIPVQKN